MPLSHQLEFLVCYCPLLLSITFEQQLYVYHHKPLDFSDIKMKFTLTAAIVFLAGFAAAQSQGSVSYFPPLDQA